MDWTEPEWGVWVQWGGVYSTGTTLSLESLHGGRHKALVTRG